MEIKIVNNDDSISYVIDTTEVYREGTAEPPKHVLVVDPDGKLWVKNDKGKMFVLYSDEDAWDESAEDWKDIIKGENIFYGLSSWIVPHIP